MSQRAWTVTALLVGLSSSSCERLQSQFQAEWEEGRRRRASSTSAEAPVAAPAQATVAVSSVPSSLPVSSGAPLPSPSAPAAPAAGPELPTRPWDLTWLPVKLQMPDGKPGRILDLSVTSLETVPGEAFQTEVAVLGARSDSPDELDVSLFSGGELVRRERAAGLGGPQVTAGLDMMMWDERDLDFAAIEKMAADAPARVGTPHATTSAVKCARSMMLSCAVKCTVVVSGAGRDALVEFDGKGGPWKLPLVPMSDCPELQLPVPPRR